MDYIADLISRHPSLLQKLKFKNNECIYINFKAVFCDVIILEKITNFAHKNIFKNIDFDIIGGTGNAGIPLAVMAASKTKSRFCYIRTFPKKRKLHPSIEGDVKKYDKIFLMDDGIVTGKTLAEIIFVLRHNNIKINDVFVILNDLPEWKKWEKINNVHLHFLTSLQDVMNKTIENNILSKDEFLYINSNENIRNLKKIIKINEKD